MLPAWRPHGTDLYLRDAKPILTGAKLGNQSSVPERIWSEMRLEWNETRSGGNENGGGYGGRVPGIEGLGD